MAARNPQRIAEAMSYGRIAIGAGALLAPKLASRVIGFPAAHDNATARAMARLFGVRDVALGVATLRGVANPDARSALFALNAAVDGGDAASFAVPLIRRQGVDRAALGSLVLASSVTAGWLALRRGP